jgi:hypothetical protein
MGSRERKNETSSYTAIALDWFLLSHSGAFSSDSITRHKKRREENFGLFIFGF